LCPLSVNSNPIQAARKNKKKASAALKGEEEEGGEPSFSFQLPKSDLPIYMSEHKAYSSSESEFGDDTDDRYPFSSSSIPPLLLSDRATADIYFGKYGTTH
jgi:hypothetical protein